MGVIQEILAWSRDLPPWQSDAVRRIFEQRSLGSSDIDELAVLAKVHYGIANSEGHSVRPLTQEQVPASSAAERQVRLLKLRDLRHVNAVAEGQQLRFAPEGLTVIYGDNGAGKSAYSRVLKRACRARDKDEEVLPNARLREEDRGVAEAVCDVTVDGVEQVEHWRQGDDPPPILSSVAVFDSRCARVYLDDENEVAYVVYGLDIPSELASACVAVKQRLQEEVRGLAFNRAEFIDLEGETEVGRAIAQLPGQADIEVLSRLGSLEEQDRQRLVALRKAVCQNDPAAKARSLDRLRTRLVTAGTRAGSLRARFLEDELARARKADEGWRAAANAATLAAKVLSGDSALLPGTGSDPWKQMYAAARAYSEGCAYVGHAFPNVEPGARCPLCQQDLVDGAERLRRFDAFIRDKSEQEAEAKRLERERLIGVIRALDVSPLMDDPSLGEVAEVDPLAAEVLKAASAKFAAGRQEVLSMFDDGRWDALDLWGTDVEAVVRTLTARLQEQIDALNEAARGEHAKMQAELRELEARERLSSRLPKVLAAIEQEQRRLAIERCARAITTTGISRKATELTERFVTAELEQALNRELRNLGVTNVSVVLTTGTVKGETRHKLKLDLPAGFDLGSILSEGEQRIIAVASFLAEVSVTPGSETLVFDDPVSSLDHRWREAVARRLAAEAGERQVIVFTHDLYFLNLLIHEAEELDLARLAQMIVQGHGGPGMVVEDLPFQGKNTKARIGELKQICQRAGRLWREGNRADYDLLVRDGYRKLRDTWERAVEEVLFNKTIERFRKSVNTQSLRKVLVQPEDQEDVDRGMTKCSNFAHDNPLAAGISVPPPEDFMADIEALEAFQGRIENRRRS